MNFNNTLLFLCFLIGYSSLTAQEYSKIFNFIPVGADDARNIGYVDSNIVLSMTNSIQYYETNGIIKKVDLNMNRKGSIYYQPDTTMDQLIAENNGFSIYNDTIILFYYLERNQEDSQYYMAFLVDLNADSIIDTKIYSIKSESIAIVTVKKWNQNIYVLLYTVEGMKLVKLDKKLNHIKTTRLSLGRIRNCDFNIVYDQLVLLTTEVSGRSNHIFTLSMRIMNEDLEVLETFKGFEEDELMRGPNLKVFGSPDGGYVLTWADFEWPDTVPQTVRVIKLTSDLQVDWTYLFFHTGDNSLSNFRDMGNGEYFGMGTTDYYDFHDIHEVGFTGWCFLINYKGELKWQRFMTDLRYNNFHDFMDGTKTPRGYALCGVIDTLKEVADPYFNDPSTWVVTLDENGCFNGNCEEYIMFTSDTTSIAHQDTFNNPSSIQEESKVDKEKIEVYPNPTSSIATFEFEYSAKRYLRLINIQGTVIREFTVSGLKAMINIIGQPAGTYIVQILDENRRLVNTKKIVLQ